MLTLSLLLGASLAALTTVLVLRRRQARRTPAAPRDDHERGRLESQIQRLRLEFAWLATVARRAAADLAPSDARRLVQEAARDLLPGAEARLVIAPELLESGLDPHWYPERGLDEAAAADLEAARSARDPVVLEEEPQETAGPGAAVERRRALFPLVHGGRVLGVLSVRYPIHLPFPKDAKQTLEIIAAHLATVVAGSRVAEEARRQSRVFEEITSVTSTIGEAFATVEGLRLEDGLDATIEIVAEVAGVVPTMQRAAEAWQRIVDAAREVIHGDGAALLPVEATDDATVQPLTSGWRAEKELRLHLAAVRNRIQRHEHPGPLAVPDTAAGSTVERYLARAGIRALMAVPVWAKGTLTGVLYTYFRRPREFSSLEESLMQVLGSLAALSAQTDQLLDGQRALVNQTLSTLDNQLRMTDPALLASGERTAALAVRIGRELGLGPRDLTLLWLAARYRDLGRISVRALGQPETFHPDAGVEVLRPLDFLKEALPAVRHHHERFDGSGYPDRLSGRRIPLAARILAAAEVADSGLAADRPLAGSLAAAVTALRAATQDGALDPNVTAAAIRALRQPRPRPSAQATGRLPGAAGSRSGLAA